MKWLTDEWRLVLFLAGTTVRDPQLKQISNWPPAGFELVLNLSSGLVE